jgi:pyruvate-formate lyase-activating enzyme
MRCLAPWYEINITAADESVSACCYYQGKKDVWLNQPIDIATYWNGRAMRALRRIHNGIAPSDPNGCSGCFHFQNRIDGASYAGFDFARASTIENLSPAQIENLRKARIDYDTGRDRVACTPLRIYANFGFACNIDCTMCHLVPRRQTNRRQVSANSLLEWRDALASALEVSVIGGEPFVLPEAIKFVRAFIEDPAYDAVRLSIFTNGTLTHKHFDALLQKRKLTIVISLDSIGDGYEKIRVKGKWSVVEQNILKFLEIQRSIRPEWSLATSALIQKTGIPLLVQFAEFHARHGIDTCFYDFINSPGTEDAFYDENVLQNPQLLNDLPNWKDHFDKAIEIFKAASLNGGATTLAHYEKRLVAAVGKYRDDSTLRTAPCDTERWKVLLACRNTSEIAAAFRYEPASGSAPLILAIDADVVQFTRAMEGDLAATKFIPVGDARHGGALRVRFRWERLAGHRRAHVVVQDEGLVELNSERQLTTTSDSKELVLICRIPPGLHRIRLVATPTGEGSSILPRSVQLEFASVWPKRSVRRVSRRVVDIIALLRFRKLGQVCHSKYIFKFLDQDRAQKLTLKFAAAAKRLWR